MVTIASLKASAPPACSAAAAASIAACRPAVGSGTPMTPVEATPTVGGLDAEGGGRRALHEARDVCMPAGPVAALALPELAMTARRPLATVSSRVTSTGGASTPERVKRAALTGVGAVADEQAEVDRAGRLDARRGVGGAKAGRQPAVVLRDVRRALHPARREELLGERGAHGSIPSVSSKPYMRLRFWIACDDEPFQRLSIAEKTSTLPVRGSARTCSAHMFVSRTSRTPGGVGAQLDERVRVGPGLVDGVELGLIPAAASS